MGEPGHDAASQGAGVVESVTNLRCRYTPTPDRPMKAC